MSVCIYILPNLRGADGLTKIVLVFKSPSVQLLVDSNYWYFILEKTRTSVDLAHRGFRTV